MYNSLEIEELVSKSKAGSRKAFEEIVRRTYEDSYTLAFRMLGNEEDALDVVQETYIRAHRGIKKFRGESKLSTWLYRITANCANTHLSRQIKHEHAPLSNSMHLVDENLTNDPSHASNVISMRSDLQKALSNLPIKLRSVVVLRDIYGLSHDDISKELKITQAAAKVRLHRARHKLRETLYPIYRSGEVVSDAV